MPRVILMIEILKIIKTINEELILLCNKIIRGINFWIVDNKKRVLKDTEDKILTNQPWNGGTPSFKKIGRVVKSENIKRDLFKRKREPTRKIIDPMLWTKKYLKVLSISAAILSENIIGRNLSIFSSKATHKHSEDLLLRARKILNINDKKKPIIGVNIIYLSHAVLLDSG